MRGDREMETLTQMKCVACRRDAPTVTDAEIAEFHPQVPDWVIVEFDGIKRLRRVFSLDDFAQALEFTTRVGALAEEEGHHPALLTEWGGTTVRGGRTRSGACIATISSWRRKRTSCLSHELIR
jgi:4a-hydroxytetrahydrobiopterin dehydratase